MPCSPSCPEPDSAATTAGRYLRAHSLHSTSPYRACLPVLEAMVEHIGADRLMWGTDMPFQNRFCTYRQSREYIEQYAGFLSGEQLGAIMGGTAARLLDLPDG